MDPDAQGDHRDNCSAEQPQYSTFAWAGATSISTGREPLQGGVYPALLYRNSWSLPSAMAEKALFICLIDLS